MLKLLLLTLPYLLTERKERKTATEKNNSYC